MLCKAEVAYEYGAAAVVCISVRVRAVLKRVHQQIFRFTIEEDITKIPGLCNEGELDF